jgi:hypothetical protein
MSQASVLGGHAVIVLKDGRQYQGPTRVSDGLVHCDAQRRVRNVDGVTYRPAGWRSWPPHELTEIRWFAPEDDEP